MKNLQQSEIPAPKDTGNPTRLVFSPDGKTLASGSDMGFVILWDVEKRQPIIVPQKIKNGHTSSVNGLVFNSTGTLLVSGSYDSKIILWDANKPEQPLSQFSSETNLPVYSVAISQDNSTVASGHEDGSIYLWDITDNSNPTVLGEGFNQKAGAAITDLAFDPTGNVLASGSYQGIILWDVKTLSNPRKISKQALLNISKLFFYNNGKTLIASSSDSTIHFWDITKPETPTKGVTLTGGHPGQPWFMQFSPDGSLLQSDGEDPPGW